MSTEGTSSNATAELPILSLSSLRRSSLFYVINNMQKEKGNGSALQNQPTAMVGVEFDVCPAYHTVLHFEGLVIK